MPQLIESFLLARLEGALDRTGQLVSSPEVRTALRGELETDRLSRDEENLLESALSLGEPAPMEAIAACRLNRALRSAFDAARRAHSIPLDRSPPRISVVTEERSRRCGGARTAVRIELERLMASIRSEERDRIRISLLTDQHVYDALGEPRTIAIDGESLPVRRVEHPSLHVETESNIEVVAADVPLAATFAHLEELVAAKSAPSLRLDGGSELWEKHLARTLIDETLEDRYRLTRLDRVDDLGAIYFARHQETNARYRVRILEPSLAPEVGRLRQASRLLRELDRPEIVPWMVVDDRGFAIVGPRPEGIPLSHWIEDGRRWPPEPLSQLLAAILEALSLPGQGAHLGLDPGAVFTDLHRESGEIRRIAIVDWGIRAAMFQRTYPGSECHFPMTWASPEVHGCLPPGHVGIIDERADIFSLGVLAYQLSTKRLPFDPATGPSTRKRVHTAARPELKGTRKYSSHLAAFIERCLSVDRDERFVDFLEARKALEGLVQIRRPRAALPRVVTNPPISKKASAIAAIVVVGLALAALWMLREDQASAKGTGFRVSDSPVAFPAGQPRVVLSLMEIPSNILEKNIRLVSASEASKVIPGWNAQWVKPAGVALVAPKQRGSLPPQVALRFWSEDRTPILTEPFTIQGFGSSLNIVRVGVPGLGNKALDPTGNAMEIVVSVSPDQIASVQVQHGQKSVDAVHASGSKYRASLDGLGLQAGKTKVAVVVQDREGTSKATSIPLDVVTSPLSWKTELRVLPYKGGDKVTPTVVISMGNRADVTWAVLEGKDGHRSLLNGTLTGKKNYALKLPPVNADGSGFQECRIALTAVDGAYVLRGKKSRSKLKKVLPISLVP